MVTWNSASWAFADIWESRWVGIIAIKTERTQIHFLSDVVLAVASLVLLKSLPWSNDANVNEDVKKIMGFRAKQQLGSCVTACLYISYLFLHDYNVKMHNFAFYGLRKQAIYGQINEGNRFFNSYHSMRDISWCNTVARNLNWYCFIGNHALGAQPPYSYVYYVLADNLRWCLKITVGS